MKKLIFPIFAAALMALNASVSGAENSGKNHLSAAFKALTASVGRAENPEATTHSSLEVQGRPVSAWVLDVVDDELSTRLKALTVLLEAPKESLSPYVHLFIELATNRFRHEDRDTRVAAAKLLVKSGNLPELSGDFFTFAADGDEQVGALFLTMSGGNEQFATGAWRIIFDYQCGIQRASKEMADDCKAGIERVKAFLVKNMSPALAKALAQEAQKQEKQNDTLKERGLNQKAFFKTLSIFKTLTAGSADK